MFDINRQEAKRSDDCGFWILDFGFTILVKGLVNIGLHLLSISEPNYVASYKDKFLSTLGHLLF